MSREEATQKPNVKMEDNFRMDVRKTGWEGVDWMHLAQDRDQKRQGISCITK
jgi:hypothetical protein